MSPSLYTRHHLSNGDNNVIGFFGKLKDVFRVKHLTWYLAQSQGSKNAVLYKY